MRNQFLTIQKSPKKRKHLKTPKIYDRNIKASNKSEIPKKINLQGLIKNKQKFTFDGQGFSSY